MARSGWLFSIAYLAVLVWFSVPLPAVVVAEPGCSPDALGTSRILGVEASTLPRVGRKQFPGTLPLARGEFVLTFDDGPRPGTTAAVLQALRAQCVKATFFLVGRNAVEHPDLVRRERAEGHTVAHHTWSHPLLTRMSASAAEAQIDRGFAAVDDVLYGKHDAEPRTPFFRFPGFAATPALLDRLQRRDVVVFGADLWASDWIAMSPDSELRLVLQRMEQAGRGIVLFHDTKRQTATTLPALLRAMKARGDHVVHVVPGKSGDSKPSAESVAR